MFEQIPFIPEDLEALIQELLAYEDKEEREKKDFEIDELEELPIEIEYRDKD
jgi:hypothetical protein